MKINSLLEGASIRLTRSIAVKYASSIPLYPVIEFPKSGGTWVSQMLSESLGLPFAQYYRMPLVKPCVFHGHWEFHSEFENVTYLMRDGRDVMVSFYFHFTRETTNPNQSKPAIFIDKLRRLLGPDTELFDVRKNLPRFIEYLFANPVGVRENWCTNNLAWANQPRVHCLKYEDLRFDCVETMKSHVFSLVGNAMDEARVEQAVDRFSMKNMTGRNPGEEDASSFIRKGVVGDWKNHFSREAAEVFDQLGGDALVKLGYEQDNSWVKECD